jgi:tetratricopeptide (TPR) repeat protein
MMNDHVQRARFLLEQGRFEQAERELREAVAADPEDARPRTLLAVSLAEQKRHDEALKEARAAIGLAPDWAYPHYVVGIVLEGLGKHSQAEAMAREAVRLDPASDDAYALLAQTLINQARWREALETAERGLALDAENVTCANFRAMALTKLRRRDDATVALETALGRDPENAMTHANRGWAQLEAGDHRAAMASFREALRLNPHSEWAKRGVIKALNARNPLYRVMLSYFFWMSRMTPRVRYTVIFGLAIGRVLVQNIAEQNPAAAPFLYPIIAAYVLFVLFTWTADPLFNLLLRFDPVGRYVLSPAQVRAANGVGACVWVGIAALVTWLITRSETMVVAGVFAMLMLIPVAATLRASSKTAGWVLGALTGLLGLLGTGAIVGMGLREPRVLGIFAGVLALGFGLFAWAERRR